MNLNTQIAVGIQATLTGQANSVDTGVASLPANAQAFQNLLNGTGAGQADVVAAPTGTVPANGAALVILSDGSVKNGLNQAFTPARLKAIYLANTGTVALTFGGNLSMLPASNTLVLNPGESFVKWVGITDSTGYAITASSADRINVINTTGTQGAFSMLLLGCSA